MHSTQLDSRVLGRLAWPLTSCQLVLPHTPPTKHAHLASPASSPKSVWAAGGNPVSICQEAHHGLVRSLSGVSRLAGGLQPGKRYSARCSQGVPARCSQGVPAGFALLEGSCGPSPTTLHSNPDSYPLKFIMQINATVFPRGQTPDLFSRPTRTPAGSRTLRRAWASAAGRRRWPRCEPSEAHTPHTSVRSCSQ